MAERPKPNLVAVPPVPKAPTFGGKPIAFGADLARPLPPKDFLFRHFGWGPGRACMISARGGVGKTLALQAIELAVAGGLPEAWGVPVSKHGGVLHLDYEMGGDLARRYQRLAGPLGVSLAELGERLAVVSFPNVYMTTEGEFYTPLVRLCEHRELLVIDSFAAAGLGFTAGENDSSARLYLDQLSRISEQTGCTVVVIHHDGKSGKTRGSSGIEDALGSLVQVTSDKDGTLILTHEKASSGPKAEPLYLRIRDVGEQDPSGMSTGLLVEAVGAKRAPGPSQHDGAESSAMHAIRVALENGPMNRSALLGEVAARAAVKANALRALVQDGAVTVSNGPGNTKLYALVPGEEALA